MRWEYRVIAVNFDDGSEGERTLNEFGAQGWELIAQVPKPRLAKHFADRLRWIFKRAVDSNQA